MVPEPVDLMQLSKEDFKKFLDSFDYVFSDCDGVIWSKAPLPRTGEFFALMKKYGKKVHYVSNNSTRTSEGYKRLFEASEIKNGLENLTIPSVAIAEYLKSAGFKKKIYCVTCPQTARLLESYGFTCKEGPDVGSDSYMDYVQYLTDDTEIGAVVYDSDYKINLPKLYKSITYLKRPDVHFLSGATDKVVPLGPGIIALGVGVFTDIVREQAQRDPIQLGKPGKVFAEFAMKRAGATDPGRVLFIGDMIEQDVGLGKAAGFKTLLVLNSVSGEEMMSNKSTRPDYYAPSLGSIVPSLEGRI